MNRFRKFIGIFSALIAGLILVILIAEIGIRASVYLFYSNRSKINLSNTINSPEKVINIVVSGESTTAVAANPENTLLVQGTAYPYQLQKILNEKGTNLKFHVENRGIMSGNTTKIVDDLEEYTESNKPDYIVVMMGMKDIVLDTSLKLQILGFLENNFKIYNYFRLMYEESRQRYTDIDDRKKVSDIADIGDGFYRLLTKFYRNDLSRQVGIDNINYEQLRKYEKKSYLAKYYFYTGQLQKAEKEYKEIVEKTGFGYLNLADTYVREASYDKAKDVYLDYIKKSPKNYLAQKEYIYFLIARNQLNEAEKFLTSIPSNVEDISIDLAKAEVLKLKKEYIKSDNLLIKNCGEDKKILLKGEYQEKRKNFEEFHSAVRDELSYQECLFSLAEMYYYEKKYELSKKTLLKYIKVDPRGYASVNLLKKILKETHEEDQAIEVVLKLAKKNKRLGEYYELVDLYKNSNRAHELKHVYEMSQEDFPETTANYKRVADIAKKTGAKLIIMQYPTFSLDYLKSFTKDIKDVYYISNEHIFDEGEKSKYLFEPRFPYKFNHYTEYGAKVLAENLANEIIKIVKEDKK